jgi:thiosulfate dehydrogenase [quinone] large subunit
METELMSETVASTAGKPGPGSWDLTFAFWVLRLWLGLRTFLSGVQKFSAYHVVATPLIDPSTGQSDASGVIVNARACY